MTLPESGDAAIVNDILINLVRVSHDLIDADRVASARESCPSVEPYRTALRQLDEVRQLIRQLSRDTHRAELRAAVDRINTHADLLDAAQAALSVSSAARRVHDAIMADQFANYAAEGHLLGERIKAKLVESEFFWTGVATQRAGRSAAWLVRCAAYLVPAEDRVRYSEEFEAELAELAVSGRLRPLSYGIRLMARVVPLRWALRRPTNKRVR